MLGLNYLAWLGILVWVIVPLAAWLAAWLIWRRSDAVLNKAFALAAGFAILAAPLLISNGVKVHYDRQVRELCAKDGGVRVYETVRLSADKFNEWGQPNFRIPITPYNKLDEADDYHLKWEITHIKFGNPSIDRSRFLLIRRGDNKVLGESVSYSRGECCLPGPGVGSTFSCPAPTKRQSFESAIFIKVDKQ